MLIFILLLLSVSPRASPHFPRSQVKCKSQSQAQASQDPPGTSLFYTMPRSRTPSPYSKSRSTTDKLSSRQQKKPSDKYRSSVSSSRPRRSRSPSSKPHKSRHISPTERSRSRRSRSPSSKHRRLSRSPSKYKKSSSRSQHYASSRRRSRSRDSPYRHKSSKDEKRRRRRDSSSSSSSSSTSYSSRSSSSSSRSKSPVQSQPNHFIPLAKGFARPFRSRGGMPFGVRPIPGLTQSLFKLSLELPKESKRAFPVSPPRTTFASVDQLLEDPIMPETLDTINAEGFVARSFVSKTASTDKVIIDLDRETVTVSGGARGKADVEEVDPIFYPNVSKINII